MQFIFITNQHVSIRLTLQNFAVVLLLIETMRESWRILFDVARYKTKK